ncbi:MAG: STAS domain-containing protein [Acidobacteriota bacterium]
MLSTRSAGPIEIVALTGDIDAASTPSLRSELAALVDSGKLLLILNLSKVRIVDSSALRLFVVLVQHCRAEDGDVALACPTPTVRSILHLTQLNRVLEVFDSEELAIGRLSPN